jgi:hypothetical protein
MPCAAPRYSARAQIGVTPWNGQDSTVSRTGSGTRSGGNGRAKACCCPAKRSEPVRSDADIGIPQIITGEIDVLPVDGGKVGEQRFRDHFAAATQVIYLPDEGPFRVEPGRSGVRPGKSGVGASRVFACLPGKVSSLNR